MTQSELCLWWCNVWLVQTEHLMRKYAEKRLKEEKEMRELVQQVADGHKNSKAAKAKLQEIKQRIGTIVDDTYGIIFSQGMKWR